MFTEIENPIQFKEQIVCCSAVFSNEIADSKFKIRLPLALDQAVQKRKAEYLASRLCAEKALRILAPLGKEFSLLNDPNRSPIWPENVTGSLTHTGHFTSVAVANKKNIKSLGIDSEEIVSTATAVEVGSTVLSPVELQRFSGHWNQPLLVTMAFSAKESIYKCLFPLVNKFFGFSDVELLILDQKRGTFSAILKTQLNNEFAANYILNGYLTVATTHIHTALVLK